MEYLLKDKYMKEVVSAMDVIINFLIQEIIRHNKYQMRFMEELVFLIDQKLMINSITCSMLEFPSTSDYYEIDNGVSK